MDWWICAIKVATLGWPENEDILLHIMSEQEAFEALAGGQCNNAASIICLQWLQLNRASLLAELS